MLKPQRLASGRACVTRASSALRLRAATLTRRRGRSSVRLTVEGMLSESLDLMGRGQVYGPIGIVKLISVSITFYPEGTYQEHLS